MTEVFDLSIRRTSCLLLSWEVLGRKSYKGDESIVLDMFYLLDQAWMSSGLKHLEFRGEVQATDRDLGTVVVSL